MELGPSPEMEFRLATFEASVFGGAAFATLDRPSVATMGTTRTASRLRCFMDPPFTLLDGALPSDFGTAATVSISRGPPRIEPAQPAAKASLRARS